MLILLSSVLGLYFSGQILLALPPGGLPPCVMHNLRKDCAASLRGSEVSPHDGFHICLLLGPHGFVVPGPILWVLCESRTLTSDWKRAWDSSLSRTAFYLPLPCSYGWLMSQCSQSFSQQLPSTLLLLSHHSAPPSGLSLTLCPNPRITLQSSLNWPLLTHGSGVGPAPGVMSSVEAVTPCCAACPLCLVSPAHGSSWGLLGTPLAPHCLFLWPHRLSLG